MSAGAKFGDGKSTTRIKGRLICSHLCLYDNRMICDIFSNADQRLHTGKIKVTSLKDKRLFKYMMVDSRSRGFVDLQDRDRGGRSNATGRTRECQGTLNSEFMRYHERSQLMEITGDIGARSLVEVLPVVKVKSD
jgi:hypothetical protein